MDNIDKTLVKELKLGSCWAFDSLYNKYSERIYAFSLKILKAEVLAEEVVQDVFLKLWEIKKDLKEECSFKSYLFTVTYNSCINILRKKKKELAYNEYIATLFEIENVYDSPQIILEYNELKSRVETIVQSMPPKRKQIYLLSRKEGKSYAEIAKEMDVSTKTVENHMNLALKNLKKELPKMGILSLLYFELFIK